MPIYEYRCLECNHKFDMLQKFDDEPVKICPKCGGTVKKLISSAAFHLKGTGWYATDFADKKTSSSETKASSEA